MCRAMEEIRNDAAFKTRVEAIIGIMESFNVSVHDAMKALKIPESDYARYIAAI
ncbi:MAG: hypothetical protein IKK34_03865 [Clostridia bacterium]|nr:hypothetical protein [Clostridia bacterium]